MHCLSAEIKWHVHVIFFRLTQVAPQLLRWIINNKLFFIWEAYADLLPKILPCISQKINCPPGSDSTIITWLVIQMWYKSQRKAWRKSLPQWPLPAMLNSSNSFILILMAWMMVDGITTYQRVWNTSVYSIMLSTSYVDTSKIPSPILKKTAGWVIQQMNMALPQFKFTDCEIRKDYQQQGTRILSIPGGYKQVILAHRWACSLQHKVMS